MALKVRKVYDTRHTPHTHAHVTHGTQQCSYSSSGGIIFAEEVEKDAPKKGLKLSTTPAYVRNPLGFCLLSVLHMWGLGYIIRTIIQKKMGKKKHASL